MAAGEVFCREPIADSRWAMTVMRFDLPYVAAIVDLAEVFRTAK